MCFHFHLILEFVFISFLISSGTQTRFRHVLSDPHECEYVPESLLLLTLAVVFPWDQVGCEQDLILPAFVRTRFVS